MKKYFKLILPLCALVVGVLLFRYQSKLLTLYLNKTGKHIQVTAEQSVDSIAEYGQTVVSTADFASAAGRSNKQGNPALKYAFGDTNAKGYYIHLQGYTKTEGGQLDLLLYNSKEEKTYQSSVILSNEEMEYYIYLPTETSVDCMYLEWSNHTYMPTISDLQIVAVDETVNEATLKVGMAHIYGLTTASELDAYEQIASAEVSAATTLGNDIYFSKDGALYVYQAKSGVTETLAEELGSVLSLTSDSTHGEIYAALGENGLAVFRQDEKNALICYDGTYFADAVSKVCRTDDLIAVVEGKCGVEIFDAEMNFISTLFGNINYECRDVAFYKHYAFVSCETGIFAYDIQNLGNPEYLRFYEMKDTVGGIQVADKRLYVCTTSAESGQSGMNVYDLDDEHFMKVVDGWRMNSAVSDGSLSVYGNEVYLSLYEEGLHIIDVTADSSKDEELVIDNAEDAVVNTAVFESGTAVLTQKGQLYVCDVTPTEAYSTSGAKLSYGIYKGNPVDDLYYKYLDEYDVTVLENESIVVSAEFGQGEILPRTKAEGESSDAERNGYEKTIYEDINYRLFVNSEGETLMEDLTGAMTGKKGVLLPVVLEMDETVPSSANQILIPLGKGYCLANPEVTVADGQAIVYYNYYCKLIDSWKTHFLNFGPHSLWACDGNTLIMASKGYGIAVIVDITDRTNPVLKQYFFGKGRIYNVYCENGKIAIAAGRNGLVILKDKEGSADE